jgi:hypothetical protein
VKLPTFECSPDILGNFGNLTDFGRALGSIPGQLGAIVDCVAEDLRKQIEEAIKPYLDTIRAIMKVLNLRIPDPIFGTIEIPEFEFELRLAELWSDFKFYLYEKLIEIIRGILKFLGFERLLNILKTPIPFLEGVYLIDVFTEEGRARIAKAVRDRLDQVAEALGMPWDLSFTGKLTLESPDFAVQNILRRVYSMVRKMIGDIIYNLLNLIPKLLFDLGDFVKKLWDALKLPFMPLLSLIQDAFNFKKLFTNIWESVVEEFDNAVDRMEAMIERILNFNILDVLKLILPKVFWEAIKKLWIFGDTVRKMLKMSDEEWNLTLPEIKFARIMQAVQDLFDRIPTMLFELWLQIIKPFLEAINKVFAIFKPLLDLIPFTFCAFIRLFAAPVLGIAGVVRDMLPPGITIEVVNPLPALPAPPALPALPAV